MTNQRIYIYIYIYELFCKWFQIWCLCFIIIILFLREFFTPTLADGFFTGVWVTTNVFKSPRLFSIYLLILIMLYSRLSPLVLLFPSLPVPLLILWRLFQVHRLRLVSPSPSCSIIYLVLLLFLSLFFFVGPSQEHYLIVFHWSVSDGKCLLVSRSLFSILADLNNAVF